MHSTGHRHVSDLEFLVETARLVDRLDEPAMRHLSSPLSLRHYMRIADETTSLMRGTRVLDWGSGYGQLSSLLRRRGLDATSYELAQATGDERLPALRPPRAVRGDHACWLPFRAGAFDAVLACGVLEHVDDPVGSLSEIHRVLKPGGQLFVYNLPQRTSYKEIVIERLRLGYAHPRRYTRASITSLLCGNGFRVVRVRRSGMLPHLATGLPPRTRRLYYRISGRLYSLDRVLARLPLLNAVAESLEVVAEARHGACQKTSISVLPRSG